MVLLLLVAAAQGAALAKVLLGIALLGVVATIVPLMFGLITVAIMAFVQIGRAGTAGIQGRVNEHA
jgi:hypothetical protein